MSELNTFIDDLIDQKDHLSEQLKNFNAEEKVAKALKEIEEIKRASLYVMKDQEDKDAKEFIEKHWNSCKGNVQYIRAYIRSVEENRHKEMLTDIQGKELL
ncbi:hypothetical protein [Bacillus licheniformis]|uniref:hypothetical protein n=1 Tax=Bacillus licheniformis TaxID=1402 RepID=UPI000926D9F9|nr:hypothetical protein [Bacillus licheniformis]OJT57397.1 hypothetical protein BFP47_11875 [Bacillus licheniformis]OJT69961.1 hypothetical protein BFP46_05015 [Bacillus licheniformis]